jgi:hypothetical protein
MHRTPELVAKWLASKNRDTQARDSDHKIGNSDLKEKESDKGACSQQDQIFEIENAHCKNYQQVLIDMPAEDEKAKNVASDADCDEKKEVIIDMPATRKNKSKSVKAIIIECDSEEAGSDYTWVMILPRVRRKYLNQEGKIEMPQESKEPTPFEIYKKEKNQPARIPKMLLSNENMRTLFSNVNSTIAKNIIKLFLILATLNLFCLPACIYCS